MVASKSFIFRATERLSHVEACQLADQALTCGAQTIVLDMSCVQDATTSAFARLVILRRDLLQKGRDVRLAGLRGQPSQLFEVHRLHSVLPRISELPTGIPMPSEPIARRQRPAASKRASHCVLQ